MLDLDDVSCSEPETSHGRFAVCQDEGVSGILDSDSSVLTSLSSVDSSRPSLRNVCHVRYKRPSATRQVSFIYLASIVIESCKRTCSGASSSRARRVGRDSCASEHSSSRVLHRRQDIDVPDGWHRVLCLRQRLQAFEALPTR